MPTESPLLSLPGAVAGAGLDAGVAAHYGNPVAEQRRLLDGSAVAELPRGVVTVTGVDRLSWLDSLTSQRLTGLAEAESAESLLLDPNGRLEHDLRVVDDGGTAWVIVERAEAAPLAAFLDRMRFMLRVEVADVSDRVAVLGSFAEERIAGVEMLARWVDPWRNGSAGGASYVTAAEHPGAEWTWSETIVNRSGLAEVAGLAARGALAVAGMLAVEALRIAAWRPRVGAETDERTIPHELDWLRSAVHLNKGCYRGQETVAKVLNLGRPPRRLVLLNLDGSDNLLVNAGDVVLDPATGTEVGRVTSAGLHHELGPIALAVVKRSVGEDLTLAVRTENGAVAAAQEVIVPSGAGPALTDLPKLPRVGAQPRR